MEGLKAREAMPMEESWPGIRKVSFREIGSPWRGPRGFLWVERWASSSWARARASAGKNSVRQFV